MNKWHIVLQFMCIIFVCFGGLMEDLNVTYTNVMGVQKLSTRPSRVAEVEFPSGAKAYRGSELTPDQVEQQPTVKWEIADNSDWYTICLIEPDESNWKNYSITGYRHWLVGNIPRNNVSAGEILSEYEMGVSPEEIAGGNHTYQLLVYKQVYHLNFIGDLPDDLELGNRSNFDFSNFVYEYMLSYPLYGNSFWIQYENRTNTTTE